MLIPYVVDNVSNGERSYDIYSRLLEDRIIFLSGEINAEVANSVIAQMLFLEGKDNSKDICLYINSPGEKLMPVLQFMTQWTTLNVMFQPFVLGFVLLWRQYFWAVAKRENALP